MSTQVTQSTTTICSRADDTNRRTGAVILLVAILMVPLMGFLAFVVDVGYIALEKARLQAAADAAALAAVAELPDDGIVDSVAQQYAALNYPHASNILNAAETETGQWDVETGVFTVSASSSANAVRVTLRRNAARANALTLFFAPVINVDTADLNVSAIALKSGGDCFDRGIIAGDFVSMGQDVRQNAYCIYGRNGVQYGQDPLVTNGSKTGAVNEDWITWGQDPVGLPENIMSADKQPVLANNVFNIIDALENGQQWPPQITQVVYMGNDTHPPNNVLNGTAYIFDESITIDQDYWMSDVIFASRKNISFGQDGKIRNSGDPNAGDFAVGLFAGETITLGQDAVVDGVNLVAGKDVIIGQDIGAFDASIQAVEKVTIGQDPHFNPGWVSSLTGFEGANGTGSGSTSTLVN